MPLTFKYVSDLASKYGYSVERTERREDPFELFSNEKMPGVTDSGTLGEMYSELYGHLQREGIIDAHGKWTKAA